MIADFIESYGASILYAVLTALAGALGAWFGRLYRKYVDDRTKQAVVTTCCRAVEQLYRDLKGPEKYAQALRFISEMLMDKGIKSTELEIRLLIESVCQEFREHSGLEASEAAEDGA